MNYNKHFLIVALVAFIGCNSKNEGNIKVDFKHQYGLNAELIDSSIQVADPTYLFTSGNYLLWKDPFNDYNITIYEIDSKKSKRFIKKGNGPMEYSQTPFIYCYNSNNSFIIETFTPTLNRVCQYSFLSMDDSLSLIKSFMLTTGMNTKFSSNPMEDTNTAIPMRGVETSENSYLAMGFFKSLFGIYKNGAYLKSAVNFIEPPAENVSKYHQSASSLNSVFQFNHKKRKLALGYTFGKVLTVYSVDNDSIAPDWTLKDFIPYYITSGTHVIADSKKTRYGYVDITSSDKYIYALYSGQQVGDNISSYYSKIIEVFSWEGTPVCKLTVDTPLTCIAVTNDNKYIYGFGNVENSFNLNLYKIKIPHDAIK